MSYSHGATYLGQFGDEGRITLLLAWVAVDLEKGNGRRSQKFEGSDFWPESFICGAEFYLCENCLVGLDILLWASWDLTRWIMGKNSFSLNNFRTEGTFGLKESSALLSPACLRQLLLPWRLTQSLLSSVVPLDWSLNPFPAQWQTHTDSLRCSQRELTFRIW